VPAFGNEKQVERDGRIGKENGADLCPRHCYLEVPLKSKAEALDYLEATTLLEEGAGFSGSGFGVFGGDDHGGGDLVVGV
jgi:hypothetical protein